jgi:hypothetical protein
MTKIPLSLWLGDWAIPKKIDLGRSQRNAGDHPRPSSLACTPIAVGATIEYHLF